MWTEEDTQALNLFESFISVGWLVFIYIIPENTCLSSRSCNLEVSKLISRLMILTDALHP